MDKERPNPDGLKIKNYNTFQRYDHTKKGTQTKPSIGLPHNLNMKMT